jgi:DNA-binding XRE family transcriptional regulator
MPKEFKLPAQVVDVQKRSMRLNFMGARGSIGLFIRAMRAAAGLTQAELGQKIGCASATISNMERGKRMEPGNVEGALKHLCPLQSSTKLTNTAIARLAAVHHNASLLDAKFR